MTAVSTNRWDELSPPEIGHWTPRLRASVVVPYYDSLAALRRTLIGLAAQTYPADLTEIIVVDDGSPRALTKADIKDLASAEIVTRDDVGFTLAAARNEGAGSARGEVLIFLDHDMLPDPTWLESHMRWHHAGSRPMLVLGSRAHIDDDWLTEEGVAEAMRDGGIGTKLHGRKVEVPEWIEFHLQRTSRLTSSDDDIFRIVTGGNLSMSRELFDSIGGFDASFTRWGGEDTELGYRAWVSGALLIPEPGAHCWHQGLGVVPDDSERVSQRVQQRKLAHLIPVPGFRDSIPGRVWSRPRLVALVIGDGPDLVAATVQSLLRLTDVAVLIESEHPLLLEDFEPDPRVDMRATPDADKFRFSPFVAHVPAGLGVSGPLVDDLIEEARRSGVAETRDGVRIESRRHLNSAAATVSTSQHMAGRARGSSSTATRVWDRVKRIRTVPDAVRAARWLLGAIRRRLSSTRSAFPPTPVNGSARRPRLESDAWSRVVAVDVPGLPATGRVDDARVDLVVSTVPTAQPAATDARQLSLTQATHRDLLAYPPLDSFRALAVIRGDEEAGDALTLLLKGQSPDATPPGPRTAEAVEMVRSVVSADPGKLESIRRAVLAEHLSVFRLDQLRSAAGMSTLAPKVSLILATRRANNLQNVIEAIARQTYPDIELILATHGIDVPDEVLERVRDSGIDNETVAFAVDETFGSVLAKASRHASGRLLAKIDDDDLYSCSHVEDLVLAHLLSGADLVGKGAEFVHLERPNMTIRRFVGGAYSHSRTIAGGAMAVTREALERAGGWADVRRHVDQALIRDVVGSGGSVFRTHGVGYVLVRHDDHTWQSDEARFLDQAEERWPGLPDWILGDHPADGCHPGVIR